MASGLWAFDSLIKSVRVFIAGEEGVLQVNTPTASGEQITRG